MHSTIRLTLLGLLPQTVSVWASQQTCTSGTFQALLSSTVSIEKVDWVPSGGAYNGDLNLAYPAIPMGLPELCAVTVKVKSSATSSYRFGLFLPTAWNDSMLTVGNGGFAGGINWLDMAQGPHYGMATISTDTGHAAIGFDATWALSKPEVQNDWGWRSIHGSVQLGKRMAVAYYGSSVKHSYYSGCSTGGRQGLRELQEFEDSFDGALIGAPAWYTTHLYAYAIYASLPNIPLTDPRYIGMPQFYMIANEVVKQCDGLDGVVDNIVSQPWKCQVDWTKIRCGQPTANPLNCLNAQQIQTITSFHKDWISADGSKNIHPGYEVGAEEQLWFFYGSGVQPASGGIDFMKYFQYNDAAWDYRTQFNESVVDQVTAKNPGSAAAEKYDLSAFKARGGKLILYHGMSDSLIPFRSSQLYYNRTKEAMGGNVDDFFRFFPVPGMQHCFATPQSVNAPWQFGGASQAGSSSTTARSVPGFQDSQHDVLMALVEWVEKGKAVDSVVATAWNSPADSSSGVYRQRPICPFPKQAVYNGQGDVKAASSWACN